MPYGAAELDDARLVRAVQDGDPTAFDTLFRRHYSTVRRVCARRMASSEEADEVAQAAFVRAYERIDDCAGDRRFGAWVQVIALRQCADVWRARARTTPVEDPAGDAVAPNECEEAVLRKERASEVRRALAELPTRQREVIVARDLEGRRPREIAAALAVSVGTVDSLLMRARRRMVAACRATGTEQGAVTASASTVSLGVAAVAADRPLGRMLGALGSTLDSAASRVAAALGVGPAGAGLGPRVAEVVAAGVLAVAPLAPAGPSPAAQGPAGLPVPVAVPLPGAVDGRVALPAAGVAPPAPPALVVPVRHGDLGEAPGAGDSAVAAPTTSTTIPSAPALLGPSVGEAVTSTVGAAASVVAGALGGLADTLGVVAGSTASVPGSAAPPPTVPTPEGAKGP